MQSTGRQVAEALPTPSTALESAREAVAPAARDGLATARRFVGERIATGAPQDRGLPAAPAGRGGLPAAPPGRGGREQPAGPATAAAPAPSTASPGANETASAADDPDSRLGLLVEALEEHLLLETERRGGRWTGVF